jgi:hypothetical protein
MFSPDTVNSMREALANWRDFQDCLNQNKLKQISLLNEVAQLKSYERDLTLERDAAERKFRELVSRIPAPLPLEVIDEAEN